jgi:diguanylate cyclase (GGDEF)-like protein
MGNMPDFSGQARGGVRTAGHLAALREMAEQLNQLTELRPMLDAALRLTLQLVDLEAGWINLLDPDGRFQQIATRNLPPGLATDNNAALRWFPCHCQQMLLDGELAGAANIVECDRLRSVRDQLKQAGAEAVRQATRGLRFHTSVPLHARDRVVGIMNLASAENKVLEEGDLTLLSLIGETIGIALHRAQLFEQERDQRELAETLSRVTAALSATPRVIPMLDRLLEQIERVIPYDYAAVVTMADDTAQVRHQRGYEELGLYAESALPASRFSMGETRHLRHMVQTEQPLLIADVHDYQGWEVTELSEHTRSWLGAPVMAHGQVIAFLTLSKQEPNFYAAEHGRRLATFADQAAIALQTAELLEETHEALEREQRLVEMGRVISSDLDLNTTLQNVVHLAMELVDADAATIAVLSEDGQQITYPYLVNLPATLRTASNGQNRGVAWHIVRTRRSVRLAKYADHIHALPEWVDVGIKAFIGVPVMAGHACLGALGLFRTKQSASFTERHLALAESVGRQAGVAIQNARLFQAQQRRAKEAEQLYQAGAVVASTLNQAEAIQLILEQLGQVVSYDSASVQFMHDGYLEVVGGRNLLEPRSIVGLKFPVPGDNPNAAVVRQKRPVILPDAPAEYAIFATAEHSRHIKSWLGVPLVIRDEVIGIVTLDSTQADYFTDHDAHLVLAFADYMAIAIENARLFAEVQHLARHDALTGLFNRRYFFEMAEAEIERVRRYGDDLAALMIDLDDFKRVNDNWGHIVGDQLLALIAAETRASLRDSDIIGRHGGEEFFILLPETDVRGARQVAERLRQLISSLSIDRAGATVRITASIGVASYDANCANLEALLKRADQALYVAKAAGRNRVAAWSA